MPPRPHSASLLQDALVARQRSLDALPGAIHRNIVLRANIDSGTAGFGDIRNGVAGAGVVVALDGPTAHVLADPPLHVQRGVAVVGQPEFLGWVGLADAVQNSRRAAGHGSDDCGLSRRRRRLRRWSGGGRVDSRRRCCGLRCSRLGRR